MADDRVTWQRTGGKTWRLEITRREARSPLMEMLLSSQNGVNMYGTPAWSQLQAGAAQSQQPYNQRGAYPPASIFDGLFGSLGL